MKYRSLHDTPPQPVSHNPDIVKQVLLARGDVPHITQFAQSRFAPGQVATAHKHVDMAEVFFVAAGTGTFTVDGAAHRLAPGSCILIVPGETHEIANTGADELVLLYFGVEV